MGRSTEVLLLQASNGAPKHPTTQLPQPQIAMTMQIVIRISRQHDQLHNQKGVQQTVTPCPHLLSGSPPRTHIALWNAHSLVNKLDYMQSCIYSKSIDIICITETWLHDSILNTEIFSHNYTIYRRDRGSRGGGIVIAISDNLTSKIVLCHISLESIAVEIDISPKTLIVCMYGSPFLSRGTSTGSNMLSKFIAN